jgi:hypothetical protein
VWIHVAVTAQGAAGKIDNEVSSAWGNASMLLVPPVEKVLRAAKFKPECYGKTVAVVYRYQLHGNAVAAPKPTNRMEQPNIMFIESEPAMTAAAPKAAAPASK